MHTLIRLRWLILIFFVALFFRVVFLGSLPATFFVDEVLSGYLGRYLWETGKDLYGNVWPLLYFNKFGDYYIILPMYLDGISTYFFGVTRFAVRFPTVLIGALSIFPIYGISRRFSQSSLSGYLTALLFAITPWHIVLSRATTESVIELFVLLLVIWSLLKHFESRAIRNVIFAIGMSVLSYFVYHVSRVLVPLIWLSAGVRGFFSLLRMGVRPVWKPYVVAGVLFLFFTMMIGRTDWGKGRFSQTSIFSEQSGVSIRMDEMTYNLGSNAVFLARIFHNKVVGYSREFVNQYLSYYSPLYVFTSQAWMKTRYAVPESGPLFVVGLVFILLFVSQKSQKKDAYFVRLFIFLLCAVAPLPAAMAVIESPNIRRSLFVLVPLLLFAGEGWARSFSLRIWKLNLGMLLSVLVFAELFLFSYYYVKQSNMYSSLYRTDGMPEIAQYIDEKLSETQTVVVFDAVDFPLYYLFQKRDFSTDWSSRFRFGLEIDSMNMVYPTRKKCAMDFSTDEFARYENAVFIQSSGCEVPLHFEKIAQIQAQNQLIRFDVLKRQQK